MTEGGLEIARAIIPWGVRFVQRCALLIPAALLAGCLLFLCIHLSVYPRSQLRKLRRINFDQISGYEFEEYCARLLRSHHFKHVCVTPSRKDHGIDILAQKGGRRYAIQCKRYSKNVGNSAVQEAYAGRAYYGADVAVVVTNRYFTAQAKREARKLGVILWDRECLQRLLKLKP